MENNFISRWIEGAIGQEAHRRAIEELEKEFPHLTTFKIETLVTKKCQIELIRIKYEKYVEAYECRIANELGKEIYEVVKEKIKLYKFEEK